MKGNIDGYTLAVVDLLTALVVVFAAMAVLAIISTKTEKTNLRQGDVVIEMTWDKSSNSDVDLWVKAPTDQPVGYAHMGDVHCNLLRDDVGQYLDPESRNQEMTVCRGADPGEWIVDVMLYRTYLASMPPVKATVTVTRISDATQLLNRTVELEQVGQQITVFRFALDKQGDLVPDSENFLFAPLYGGGQATTAPQQGATP